MPAGSDVPTLPVTFRPLGVRIAVLLFGLALLVVCGVIWFAFPQHVRDEFSFGQRFTLGLIGLAIAVGGHAVARSRVEARTEGLLTVNGYRSHAYAWDQVAGVTLRAGGPWAVLELADGSTVPAMGIQGSDGSRAAAQVKHLREIMWSCQAGGVG